MNDNKISNSIYISIATLESVIICIFGYHGLVWFFPLFLISIPIYQEYKKVVGKKD